MKTTTIALLTTVALAAPAFAANNAANQPQQPMQMQPKQTQQKASPRQQQSQNQPQKEQPQQQAQAQPQNGNQPIAPNSLSRSEVRQMQAALDKDGFKAGRPDGKWGPHTRRAVQAFDQKKGIQSDHGQPTQQTLADLGLNTSQSQNQPQNGGQQQPSGNRR